MVPIAEIKYSAGMIQKLGSKYGLTKDDVNEACTPPRIVRTTWDYHPERGRRLLVRGRTASGHVLKVVLYPTDDHGVFRLGTAIPGTRE